MKDYDEDEFIMISGIQHFEICRRQWALIHIEQQWEDNYFTIDGELKHENVDNPEIHEKRGKIISVRAMPIKSHELGITGKCDVVEFEENETGIYIPEYKNKYIVRPVEYKRGKVKENDSDSLQLLAQAVCLEEMLCTKIEYGYIFYFETRRRVKIEFTQALRDKLDLLTQEMHKYVYLGYTPKAKVTKKCISCSLKNICLPEIQQKVNVKNYINERVYDETIT